MLEAVGDTKFQLLVFFNIVGPFLGLTRNLGARHSQECRKMEGMNPTLPNELPLWELKSKWTSKSSKSNFKG
jgi:hypothetical protein